MTKDISKLSESRLIIHFDIHEPIELAELGDSFKAVANLYKGFMAEQIEDKTETAKTELYATSIKDNCILMDVGSYIEIAGYVVSAKDYLKFSIDFIKYLSNALTYFKNITHKDFVAETSEQYSKEEARWLADFINPIANIKIGKMQGKVTRNEEQADGKKIAMIVEVYRDVGSYTPPLKIYHNDALAMKKGINFETRERKKATEKKHDDIVLLRFTQTNTSKPDDKGRGGFKGIIEEISKDICSVSMSKSHADEIKQLMTDGKFNPSLDSCRVKVFKRYKGGELKSYNIVKLHGVVPKTHP